MKITKDSEYYDDVHYIWRPVPRHWVGDESEQHTFTISDGSFNPQIEKGRKQRGL